MKRTLAILLLVGLGGCGPGTTGLSTTAGTEPAIPPLESLTTEWSCGKGFWVSNARQTAALHIAYRGKGDPDRQIRLPHPDWTAEVLQGTHLHANWCDDVMEPGEPTAEEHSRLPVVEGELVLVGGIPPDTGGGGGQSATVEASDLEVELPDETREQWGSITITNSHWGLIPG